MVCCRPNPLVHVSVSDVSYSDEYYYGSRHAGDSVGSTGYNQDVDLSSVVVSDD